MTYHGPGQLVLYPLLQLNTHPYKEDIRWYIHQLEEVLLETLKVYNIDGHRDVINRGVWVKDEKIASIGVGCNDWKTSHGISLNVDVELGVYDMIVACGIEGRKVTSMGKVLKERGVGSVSSVSEVAEVMMTCFSKVFGVEVVNGEVLV